MRAVITGGEITHMTGISHADLDLGLAHAARLGRRRSGYVYEPVDALTHMAEAYERFERELLEKHDNCSNKDSTRWLKPALKWRDLARRAREALAALEAEESEVVGE